MNSNVRIVHYSSRDIRGMPMGVRTLTLRVKMHRIRCKDCGNHQVETLPFLPSPKCHFTKYLAKYALELRKHMTISATAKHLELHWSTVKEIEKSYLRKILKGKRFTLLKNIENLDEGEKADLGKIRDVYWELGEMSMMKEALRSIYRRAENDSQAEAALINWCEIARQTEVHELIQMANTIEKHMKIITAYWRTGGLSNASMEGFNNKIRWLMRQAYGYRDDEYFKWKIYDLPDLKTKKTWLLYCTPIIAYCQGIVLYARHSKAVLKCFVMSLLRSKNKNK